MALRPKAVKTFMEAEWKKRKQTGLLHLNRTERKMERLKRTRPSGGKRRKKKVPKKLSSGSSHQQTGNLNENAPVPARFRDFVDKVNSGCTYECITYSFIHRLAVWFHGERIIHQSGCPDGKLKKKRRISYVRTIPEMAVGHCTYAQHNCAYVNCPITQREKELSYLMRWGGIRHFPKCQTYMRCDKQLVSKNWIMRARFSLPSRRQSPTRRRANIA